MTEYKQKINQNGEYLPFYGYTAISMIEVPSNLRTSSVMTECLNYMSCLEKIENFIKTSFIKKYYSPLPHLTYHMTLFNIYCMASTPIPSVSRWVEKENETIPTNVWLPEDVLQIQNIKARDVLRKLPVLKIKDLELYYKKGLGVWITLEKDHEDVVSDTRKELAKIYEHEDNNLKLHLTFAYLFKKLTFDNEVEQKALKKDLQTLIHLIQPLKNCILSHHNIYLYNSMTNYFPIDFFFSSFL